MTLNDLKKEVLALMFETDLESHEAFVYAANRSLLEIYSELERLESMTLYKKKLIPNERFEKLYHEGSKNISLILNGKSFSFTAVGSGMLSIKDGVRSETLRFSGSETVIKRKINTGSVSLTFSGELDYQIYNLSSFENAGDNDGIPVFKSTVRYDVRERDSRFLSFTSTPKDSKGRFIEGLRTEGSLVLVPQDYDGDIVISYTRLPKKIEETELDTELDILPEFSHLLALRCAAYLLFDGNEGLAEYYISLYRSAVGSLKLLYSRKVTSETYSDVLGWA